MLSAGVLQFKDWILTVERSFLRRKTWNLVWEKGKGPNFSDLTSAGIWRFESEGKLSGLRRRVLSNEKSPGLVTSEGSVCIFKTRVDL